jgi:hypothetical protein
MMSKRHHSLFVLLSVTLGCQAPSADGAVEPTRTADGPDRPTPAWTWQRPSFCDRGDGEDDAVRDAFCVHDPPPIRSLMDLQRALALLPDATEDPIDHPDHTVYTVAALGHSTALSGALVSPINPRLIVMGPRTFLAFQRGVQRVELISQSSAGGTLGFYLLEFAQTCNARRGGCSAGDLYTPQIESEWEQLEIRDADDLANTAMDCRTCHQRNTDTPTLLMRELEFPWTHFFYPPGPKSSPGVSGSDLLEDYIAAKGDEPYGGYLLHQISDMTPFFLEGRAGPTQPLVFDAPVIEYERHPYLPEGYVETPQTSPTWERAYEAFKRGEQLALPYVAPRATDASKQAALTEAYQRYRAGEIPADELPDLGDIFPDDGYERARRGLQTEPGATPEQALIQACGPCHNDVLDATISRAWFNIGVAGLDRAALDEAIERLKRPPSAAGAMPPPEARQLDPDARDALIAYLRGDPAALDRDGVLARAAELGMTGGGGQRRAGGAL